MNDELQRVVLEELGAVGFDLVELRRGGTRSRPVVEVRIDRRDGAGVTVDDCARASRALEARLDGSGLVGERYVLQVSSPGERAIRTPSEWRRFSGRWANVTDLEGGHIEAKIVGLDGAEGGEIVIRADAHRTQERNRADAQARLVALVEQATHAPKPRHKTKVPRAERQRRLDHKARRGDVKAKRGRVREHD